MQGILISISLCSIFPLTATGRRVVAPARALVRVSGQYAREARGTELRAGSAEGSASAGACCVLRDAARVWVWCAASATGDEREVAKNMAAAEHTLVMQGNGNFMVLLNQGWKGRMYKHYRIVCFFLSCMQALPYSFHLAPVVGTHSGHPCIIYMSFIVSTYFFGEC